MTYEKSENLFNELVMKVQNLGFKVLLDSELSLRRSKVNPSKKIIILGTADYPNIRPFVLCHELGHILDDAKHFSECWKYSYRPEPFEKRAWLEAYQIISDLGFFDDDTFLKAFTEVNDAEYGSYTHKYDYSQIGNILDKAECELADKVSKGQNTPQYEPYIAKEAFKVTVPTEEARNNSRIRLNKNRITVE